MQMNTSLFFKPLVSPICWLCCDREAIKWDLCFSCFRSLREASGNSSSLFVYEPIVAKLIRKSRTQARHRASKIFWKVADKNGVLNIWRAQKFDRILWIPQGDPKKLTGLELFARAFADEQRVSAACGFRKVQNFYQHQKKRKDRMNGEIFFDYVGPPIKGQRILLLDDVSSTGTSLDQAKFLLKQEGASYVKKFSLVENVMNRFEGQRAKTKEEGHEMQPFLLHLFV
jgi:predicted amidophosphoribosyltransferase